MICPDCEQEVDSLTRKGICKKCNTRLNQQNYMNKRDGTNNPYVPLVELKKTNPIAYKKVMGKRGTSVTKPKKKVQVEAKKSLPDDYVVVNTKNYSKAKKTVNDNLEKVWNDKECYIKPENNEAHFYYIFLGLLKEIVSGKFAEDSAKMLTMLSYVDRYKSDVEHKIEKCKLPDDLQKLVENTIEQNYILDRRREIKDMYDNRVAIMKIATALKDTIGLDLIDNALKELDKLEKFRKDPKYCPVVDSGMSEEYDWAYKQNPDKPLYKDSDKVQNAGAHLYLVSCPLVGYKKSKQPQEFTRRVYTTTEELAIDEWKNFVKTNVKGVTYKESEIKVEIIY